MLDAYEQCLVDEVLLECEALFDVFKKKGLQPSNPAYRAVERTVVLAHKLRNNGSEKKEAQEEGEIRPEPV